LVAFDADITWGKSRSQVEKEGKKLIKDEARKPVPR
jgi:hypothetical protein